MKRQEDECDWVYDMKSTVKKRERVKTTLLVEFMHYLCFRQQVS